MQLVLDHLVMTVRDLDATVAFYRDVLGCEILTFGDNRKALRVGTQKINLHAADHTYPPVAEAPTPGALDLCFLTEMPIEAILTRLAAHGVDVIEGPVQRTGAQSVLLSVYCRDPDGNLIELSNVLTTSPPSA